MKLDVPIHLRDTPIKDAALSTRTRNSLLSGRVRTLGELHGLTLEQLGALPNLGTKGAGEIVELISQGRVESGLVLRTCFRTDRSRTL